MRRRRCIEYNAWNKSIEYNEYITIQIKQFKHKYITNISILYKQDLIGWGKDQENISISYNFSI